MKSIRKIIFNKAGGNASRNAYSCKMSIPAAAIEALGATPDDREVTLEILEGKVIITKNGSKNGSK